MNRRTAVLSLAIMPLALSGCGRLRESRLNPFNWFGRARRRESQATVTKAESADGRLLVPQVTDLTVEQAAGGAILHATGLPPTQGWWKAELKSETRGRPDENGVVTYRFLVFPPIGQEPQSTPQSRDITVAVFVPQIRLDTISEIVVQGETNALSTRR